MGQMHCTNFNIVWANTLMTIKYLLKVPLIEDYPLLFIKQVLLFALETLNTWIYSAALSGGKIASLRLSLSASWGRGRARARSASHWTPHCVDEGATVPWSSHPGEGRCSIRTEGILFWKGCFVLKKGGLNMSYQGKKNIPKITVSIKKIICLTDCRNFDERKSLR